MVSSPQHFIPSPKPQRPDKTNYCIILLVLGPISDSAWFNICSTPPFPFPPSYPSVPHSPLTPRPPALMCPSHPPRPSSNHLGPGERRGVARSAKMGEKSWRVLSCDPTLKQLTSWAYSDFQHGNIFYFIHEIYLPLFPIFIKIIPNYELFYQLSIFKCERNFLLKRILWTSTCVYVWILN